MHAEIHKTCDDGILGLTVGEKRIAYWPESPDETCRWAVFDGSAWRQRGQTEHSDADSTFVIMALNLIQAEVLTVEEMDLLHAWIDAERVTYAR